MNNLKNMVYAALLIALGVVLPLAFHATGLGSMMLPMHIPVLLAGLICGPLYGLLIGLVTPCLSFLLTGMPPVAYLPSMIFELAAYGMVSGLLIKLIRTKYVHLNVYMALIGAMIAGRGMNAFTNMVIFQTSGYSFSIWLTASFITCLPGIIVQLIAIPPIIYSLLAAKLIYVDQSNVLGIYRPIRGQGNKNRAFFDKLSEDWDQRIDRDREKIPSILKLCQISKGDKIIDIGCGTGILEPFLLKTDPEVITALDISPKMLEKAKESNKDQCINFKNVDFYDYRGSQDQDIAIVFNSYPHFTDRQLFAKRADECVKKGGMLYIIHDASRQEINGHHQDKKTQKVTEELLSATDEAKYFEKYFYLRSTVDTDDMYMISLEKK